MTNHDQRNYKTGRKSGKSRARGFKRSTDYKEAKGLYDAPEYVYVKTLSPKSKEINLRPYVSISSIYLSNHTNFIAKKDDMRD